MTRRRDLDKLFDKAVDHFSIRAQNEGNTPEIAMAICEDFLRRCGAKCINLDVARKYLRDSKTLGHGSAPKPKNDDREYLANGQYYRYVTKVSPDGREYQEKVLFGEPRSGIILV